MLSVFEPLVAERRLQRINPLGGNDVGDAVGGHRDGPVALVDEVVVVEAKPTLVGQWESWRPKESACVRSPHCRALTRSGEVSTVST